MRQLKYIRYHRPKHDEHQYYNHQANAQSEPKPTQSPLFSEKEKEDSHSKAVDEILDSIGRRLVNLFDLRPALTNIIIISILVLAIAFTNNLSHFFPEWMGDASWVRYFLQGTIFFQIIYASTRTIGLPILTIAFSSALLISGEASGTYVIPETLCQSIFAVGFIGIGAAAIFKR